MTTACQRNLPTVPASSVCFCANTRSVQSESQLGVFGVAALAPPLSRHRFFRVVATRTLLRGRDQATEIYPVENERGGVSCAWGGGGGKADRCCCGACLRSAMMMEERSREAARGRKDLIKRHEYVLQCRVTKINYKLFASL